MREKTFIISWICQRHRHPSWKKVRITLDIAESLVKEIDEIRKKIGVDRGALIKVWLHEKVKQEKATISTKNG